MTDTPASDFASLFDPIPPQWGLRGDPYLWRALRDALRGEALPASSTALAARIGELYARLVGQPLSVPDMRHVPAFAHGGMSSGCISPSFWNEQALPLLQARLATIGAASSTRACSTRSR